MRIRVRTFLIVLFNLVFFSACGIDRGGIIEQEQPPITLSPMLGGSVSGQITDIDTINSTVNINEKQFDLSSTAILLNGVAQSLNALSEGQYATTFSPENTALESPSELRVDFNTAGGGVDFDPTASTFNQFGQAVLLDNLAADSISNPMLPPAGIQSLAVSGFTTSSGQVAATSVVLYDSAEPFIVTGYPIEVDALQFTFQFGMQPFDYSSAISINTSNGMVNPLERIRVQLAPGSSGNAFNVLTIDATPLIDPRLTPGAVINLSGYVTTAFTNNDFSISNVSLITDANTIFENLSGNDLVLDLVVTIEGQLQADRRVLVQQVRPSN